MIEDKKKRISLISQAEVTKLVETASSNSLIILDFDETLLLRNSTAEYLNSLRPRIIGLLLLKLLYFLRPWCWLPKPFKGTKVQDWFLVTASTILLPWTAWISFLLATRLCFWIYNHLNKHTRTWLYLVLQSFRYYGFVVVTTTNLIGTSLLCSHILSRTMLYIVYRYSGGNADNWPKQVPEKLLRWLIFMFVLSAIAIGTGDLSLWSSWQTWAIVIWCLLQGQRQILRVMSQFKPLVRDGSNRVT